MKNIRMSYEWLRVELLLSEISRSMACSALYGKQSRLALGTVIHDRHMSLERKLSFLSIKDKNEDADDVVFQMICKSIVS